jgi:hypothetical protein
VANVTANPRAPLLNWWLSFDAPHLWIKELNVEKNQQQSRRAFLSQTGKLTTACAVIGLTGGVAQAAAPASSACIPESTPMTLTDSHYWLSDVRLEDGFEYDGETVIGTAPRCINLKSKTEKLPPFTRKKQRLPPA